MTGIQLLGAVLKASASAITDTLAENKETTLRVVTTVKETFGVLNDELEAYNEHCEKCVTEKLSFLNDLLEGEGEETPDEVEYVDLFS